MKKPPPPEESPIVRVLDRSEAAVKALRKYFASYFWAILKNVLGILLILLAVPALGVPIPGGSPLLFLVGFALVAFPGKRRLTSTVLRGRPLRVEASIFTTLTTAMSLLVIAALLWVVGAQYTKLIHYFKLDPDKSTPAFVAAVAGLCVIAAVVTWGVMWLALRGTNLLIRLVPRMRRVLRPFMRKWGIVLLPPPRHRGKRAVERSKQEIIELSPGSKRRIGATWAYLKPWLMRVGGMAITFWLFYKLVRPIVEHWDKVEPFISGQNGRAGITIGEFIAAIGLFVVFLFVFRVVSWWTLLRGLGRMVPIAPATRVWSTSELARYLPGVIWQVVGRMYLIKPYGVSGSVCSTSQVLELIIFMLANIIVAVGCLLWFGFKQVQGDARWWLIGVMCLLPALGLLLHPSVFYALMNRVIRAFKRPPLETRVPGKTLVGLLAWNVIGLCVMSMGIWLIVHGPLGLPLGKWWVVAGAYCLAWCAGFLAFWAPGGIGVREWVFMLVVVVILPPAIKDAFDHESLRDFAALVSLVLRGWATAGELVLALIAYTVDLRGAMLTFRNRGLPLPATGT
ncbi:MAG: hypothetical protein QM754_07155 [Tepidisphaeraceae bacterium]